jgi:hypothetical protein
MGMEHLYIMNQRKADITLRYNRRQNNLQRLLQDRITSARSQQAQFIEAAEIHADVKESVLPYSFQSRWLPGPLSYPWMVMMASIPQIIKAIFHYG